LRVGVLEGDVAGSFDADRLAVLNIPVVQLNTDNGFGGECHLDANMVRSALPGVPLPEMDVLIVENVGNLVCPAEFRVGEDARVMVSSVTEGEDKPLKYPLMFRACEMVVINKIDLLQYLDFDVDRLEANILQVNPQATILRVSAKTGEGIEAVRDWFKALPARFFEDDDHDHDHGEHTHTHEHGDHSHSHEHADHDHEHATA
jgi:hydrogenase nickel incorporation protein HypB